MLLAKVSQEVQGSNIFSKHIHLSMVWTSFLAV